MTDVFVPFGFGTIGIARRGPVAIIRLQRPERLNAYTPEMGEDLVSAFRAMADDASVAAIVATGKGKAFCAGADHGCFTDPPGPSGLRIGEEAFVKGFAAELRDHPKLLIAAFNGPAVGIGVSMSLVFDLRLAATDSQLKLNFAEHGIMPGFGATYLLPHLVGLGQAKKLLLCEPLIGAGDALAIGLVDEVCASAELIERACALGTAAARLRPGAATKIKRALNRSAGDGFWAALQAEAASDLRKEAAHDAG